jgi:choline monooxygenase
MTDKSISGNKGDFTDNAQHSYTLPSRYYVDPEIHQQELERIFERSWQYAGHVSDLPEIGSYLTTEIAGQPVLILRSSVEDIRAFYNVCQHRAHLLAKGRGKLKRQIVCPYHAWCYGFDGTLSAARLTDDVPDFQKAEFSLSQVNLTTAAGLIFINLNPVAKPEDGDLRSFEKSILDHLPSMAEFTAYHRVDFDIAANWKVLVDNFSEGYHIPVAHKELSALWDARAGTAEVGERYACYRRTARPGYAGFETSGDEPYVGWTLWPNLCILSLPGSPQLIVIQMNPAGPARTIEHADIYAPPGFDSANLAAVKSLFADTFNQEDIALVESVQRGLTSHGYDQSRYVADKNDSWFSEAALHRFHQLILKALRSED